MTDPVELLARTRQIVVVGCSSMPGKAAHDVPEGMLAAGYDIIPVNPHADEIFGRRAYRTLADVPGPIEMVNVFRPSPETPEVARAAVAAGARSLWLQLGIRHPEARRIAEEAGLEYVENRCLAIEQRHVERLRGR